MQEVLTAATIALNLTVASRTLTVNNHCPFTIWPAMFTDLNVGKSVPGHPNGWQQNAGQVVSFSVPSDWKAGRIWGRRNCDFSKGTPGPNSCLTGGCNGGLVCDSHTGTGVPPVTLTEFTFGTNGAPDNYDVSLVDGYDLPVRVTNNKGCPVADCPVDLGPKCPGPLKGPADSKGTLLGCKSACAAGLGDPKNNPNCCTGTHNKPQTCPPSGVEYYDYFKGNCPHAYAYAYDDPTSLFTCGSGKQADYTITFCP